MKRVPLLFGLHAQPRGWFRVLLWVIPFVILLGGYIALSEYRHAENPRDKITPTVEQIAEAAYKYAFVPDRKGEYRMYADVRDSLFRLFVGVSLAALLGLMLGMNMALFRGMDALLMPLITFLSIVPPMALLPVFMITLGTGETVKIALIFVGCLFVITRGVYNETKSIPKEQITKSLTLGARSWEVVYKIVLPQILPGLIQNVRLSLGGAWLFLIAGEAMASMSGLGYTIFVVKRYLAMDVIITYVFVITALGFLIDRGLDLSLKRLFPWYVATKGGK